MNTHLRNIIRSAEGRYLRADEHDAFLDYAQGARERIARTRRLQEKERDIVETATTALFERYSGLLEVPEARDKVVRDFQLHLRYVAQAHINDDMPWFIEQYGEWIAELLSGFTETEILVCGYEGLLQAIEEQLEPADAGPLSQYTKQFVALVEEA